MNWERSNPAFCPPAARDGPMRPEVTLQRLTAATRPRFYRLVTPRSGWALAGAARSDSDHYQHVAAGGPAVADSRCLQMMYRLLS